MTVTASEFSVGLAHKLCVAAAKVGITPAQLDTLAASDKYMGELRKFAENNFRVEQVFIHPGKLLINRIASFDPTFIGADWTIWKGSADGDGLAGDEEQDEKSLTLTKIDLSSVLFEHTLKEGETSIKGEEKLRRLKEAGRIRLDALVGMTLLNEPGRVTLAMLAARGIKWFDLPGTVLRSPDGSRYVLYLSCDVDGQWRWRCRWLGDGWDRRDPSAVLAGAQDLVASP